MADQPQPAANAEEPNHEVLACRDSVITFTEAVNNTPSWLIANDPPAAFELLTVPARRRYGRDGWRVRLLDARVGLLEAALRRLRDSQDHDQPAAVLDVDAPFPVAEVDMRWYGPEAALVSTASGIGEARYMTGHHWWVREPDGWRSSDIFAMHDATDRDELPRGAVSRDHAPWFFWAFVDGVWQLAEPGE